MLSKGIYRTGVHLIRRRAFSTGEAAVTQPLHFLDGKRVSPTNPDASHDFNVIEPSTGKTLCVMRGSSALDVDKAVQSAKEAQKHWGSLTGFERGKLLSKAGRIIKENIEEIARVEVRDAGKPIWEARADVECCGDLLEFYGGVAPTILGEHIPLPGGSYGYTRKEPIGVCGGIGAWNYPFQMACWKSGPALACGNTLVFKPSQFTPLTAVIVAEVYKDAGIPDGVFNVVQGAGFTGQALASHPDIGKMSFTGSVESGSKVMQACAKDVKQVTLELGGKSPLIIFDDVDIENAVNGAMNANFMTQGQVCSNGTRVFVHKSIMEPFLNRLIEKTKNMKIGDPHNEDTVVGATVSKEQAEKVLSYIDIAQQEGAKLVVGGERIKPSPELAGGIYISPAVFAEVTDDMRIAKEEVFGAVMSVMTFDNEEEVIRRANNTVFGLAGGVFTRDLSRAHRVIAQIKAGSCYVNCFNLVPPEIPFGGFKKSGFGRESGMAALNYYTQVKSVYVETGDVWTPFK